MLSFDEVGVWGSKAIDDYGGTVMAKKHFSMDLSIKQNGITSCTSLPLASGSIIAVGRLQWRASVAAHGSKGIKMGGGVLIPGHYHDNDPSHDACFSLL